MRIGIIGAGNMGATLAEHRASGTRAHGPRHSG